MGIRTAIASGLASVLLATVTGCSTESERIIKKIDNTKYSNTQNGNSYTAKHIYSILDGDKLTTIDGIEKNMIGLEGVINEIKENYIGIGTRSLSLGGGSIMTQTRSFNYNETNESFMLQLPIQKGKFRIQVKIPKSEKEPLGFILEKYVSDPIPKYESTSSLSLDKNNAIGTNLETFRNFPKIINFN
jgi:hypothetical protein